MWRRLLLGNLLLSLLSCTTAQPVKWTADKELRAYRGALDAWTRTSIAYRELQSQVFAKSTLLSPAFAFALERERAIREGVSEAEISIRTSQAMKASDQRLRFFLVLSTRDPLWNDLTASEPTLKVRLHTTDGQAAVKPTSIKRLSDNQMADYRPFFPYADGLTTGYMLDFPMPKRLRTLRLKIGGPPGLLEMQWQILN